MKELDFPTLSFFIGLDFKKNVSEDTSIIGWLGGKVQKVERNMVMWDSYTDTNRYIIAV